jgi:ketosteroid isomerase-like protein
MPWAEEVDMHNTPASEIVRRAYTAFEQGDRDAIEAVLAEDFTFSRPPDPHLDRAGFFERCWPNNASIRRFTFTRILEDGGEVFVTYELEQADGKRGRNTEYFVVADGQITRQDVYFGPSL